MMEPALRSQIEPAGPLGWTDVLDAASGDVRRLSSVVRYSSIPITVPENVAEHSYWVCLYSALVHQALRPSDTELVGAILLKATVHDLAECVTGDVVRTFKYSSKTLRKEINRAEDRLARDLPGPVQVLMNGLVPNLAGENYEYVDFVVKAADFMSLHQYMVREVRRGNREIMRFFLKMEDDLASMAKNSPKYLSGLYNEMLQTARNVRMGG
jgi:5'-deoxynucleotidase YfbR-like HD superfamily hydrolase